MQPFFTIIVVTLNPGDKLFDTLESIRRQTCKDYQVVVKDGGSKDGAVERLRGMCRDQDGFWKRLEIYEQADRSIYEGMNQALCYVSGRYLYFLNCGDRFYDDGVLERFKEEIQKRIGSGTTEGGKAPCGIFYGDIYDEKRGVRVASNPSMDGFGCYRNVPCHQACIYDAALFSERGYETKYRVRGDYEHFLWCFYVRKAAAFYVPVTVASYEGGGFSETGPNRRLSKKEHREITARYMTLRERALYRGVLLLSFAPLRTKMAESRRLSGLYQRLKALVYRTGQG